MDKNITSLLRSLWAPHAARRECCEGAWSGMPRSSLCALPTASQPRGSPREHAYLHPDAACGSLVPKGCLREEARAGATGHALLRRGTSSALPAPEQEARVRWGEGGYVRKGSSMAVLHSSHRAPPQQPLCNCRLTRYGKT